MASHETDLVPEAADRWSSSGLTIEPEAARRFGRHLGDDETLLWAQRATPFAVARRHLFFLSYAALPLVFGPIMMLSPPSPPASFILLFLVVWLVGVIVPAKRTLRGFKTWYAVTSERVLILETLSQDSLTSLLPASLVYLYRDNHTIRFGSTAEYDRFRWFYYYRPYTPRDLDGLTNAAEVERLILKVLKRTSHGQ